MSNLSYQPAASRYDGMIYKRCGQSGLLLPRISLGLWHNFGGFDLIEKGRGIIRRAFDKGITHFDLANNYGPPHGAAEENFGNILRKDFHGHLRDELVISTKAGFLMWPGPYGNFGSRKHLISSLDQSLCRMGLEYVDIYYSHRYDPDTPLEETMMALDTIVRQGKALYVGLSNYWDEDAERAILILRQLGTPCLIHQPEYSLFERGAEGILFNILSKYNVGCIPFLSLAQGLLTDKYLKGIPSDSRAANPNGYLNERDVTTDKIRKVSLLNAIAQKRGQSLAQMALSWVLRNDNITSVLIGVSSITQLDSNIKALCNLTFSDAELEDIEAALN